MYHLEGGSKLKRCLYLLAFAIMPTLNMIGKIIIGDAYKLRHYVTLLVPVLIFLMIGYFILNYCEKRKLSTRFMAIKILTLVGLDQFTKLIIYRFLGNGVIIIPGNMYMIKIVKNQEITALFNLMNISLPPWIITVIRILILIFIWALFKFFERKYKRDSYLTLTEIFVFAMILGSIIDSSLWGYTLDFIVSRELQAIDLKDIYASIGIGSLLLYSIKNDLFSIKST